MLQVEKKKKKNGRRRAVWILVFAAAAAGVFFAVRAVRTPEEVIPSYEKTSGSIVNRDPSEIERFRIKVKNREAWTAQRDGDGELRIEGAEGWTVDEVLGEQI